MNYVKFEGLEGGWRGEKGRCGFLGHTLRTALPVVKLEKDCFLGKRVKYRVRRFAWMGVAFCILPFVNLYGVPVGFMLGMSVVYL